MDTAPSLEVALSAERQHIRSSPTSNDDGVIRVVVKLIAVGLVFSLSAATVAGTLIWKMLG